MRYQPSNERYYTTRSISNLSRIKLLVKALRTLPTDGYSLEVEVTLRLTLVSQYVLVSSPL
jgi:hypothetical protein